MWIWSLPQNHLLFCTHPSSEAVRRETAHVMGWNEGRNVGRGCSIRLWPEYMSASGNKETVTKVSMSEFQQRQINTVQKVGLSSLWVMTFSQFRAFGLLSSLSLCLPQSSPSLSPSSAVLPLFCRLTQLLSTPFWLSVFALQRSSLTPGFSYLRSTVVQKQVSLLPDIEMPFGPQIGFLGPESNREVRGTAAPFLWFREAWKGM